MRVPFLMVTAGLAGSFLLSGEAREEAALRRAKRGGRSISGGPTGGELWREGVGERSIACHSLCSVGSSSLPCSPPAVSP
jgi:hypothetical protein